MKTYLTRWNENGVIRSTVLNVYGIRRLMQRFYEDKQHLQVQVYQLAESDVYMPPIPLRVFYDWKFNKLTLFEISGRLVEKTEDIKPTQSGEKEVA